MSAPSVSNSAGDDTVLVAQAKGGYLEAFDQLVLRHQQVVFAVALRMLGSHDDAEDVAQEAFVRAYRSLGAFRGEAKFSTWLVSITMNLCRNRRRWWARHRRAIVASTDDPLETGEGTLGQRIEDPSPSPSTVAVSRERQRQIEDALRQLDEDHRSVIVLRDIEGYAYEEIAGMLGCRVGTVKSRINRARLKLRSLLEGQLT